MLDGRLDRRKEQRREADESGCLRPFNEMVIDTYGNAHLCCADWRGDCHIGNVRRDGFAAVARRFVAVRDLVNSYPLQAAAPAICKYCTIKQPAIGELVPEVAAETRRHLIERSRLACLQDEYSMARPNNEVSFDWSLTDRKLVLFIPNHGRKRYLRSCLVSLTHTRVPREKWLVLVGNDGLDEPMDDLAEEFNLAWFTLPRRNPALSRNGAFIRNYVIKRCRSEFLFQKDPEVALVPDNADYDIIEHMMNIKSMKIWRNGRPFDTVFPEEYILAGSPIDGRFLPGTIPPLPGLFATHWGFCIRTEDLRKIRGYDERFTKYGPEDGDLFRRLMRVGFTFRCDPHVFALHVHHSLDSAGSEEMCALGRLIDSEPPVRNNPDTWGEG